MAKKKQVGVSGHVSVDKTSVSSPAIARLELVEGAMPLGRVGRHRLPAHSAESPAFDVEAEVAETALRYHSEIYRRASAEASASAGAAEETAS